MMRILAVLFIILPISCQAGKRLKGGQNTAESDQSILDSQSEAAQSGDEISADAMQSENDDPGFQVPMRACPAEIAQYKGFANESLVVGRKTQLPLEGDRYRLKPFSALDGEYRRVLGISPTGLAAAASTFADAPPRWSMETQTNAVALNTFFKLSFEVAQRFVSTDPQWAVAPTPETAQSACLSWQRKVWSRNPEVAEASMCQNLLLNPKLAKKEPRLRWAYGLASVLAASGFIAY